MTRRRATAAGGRSADGRQTTNRTRPERAGGNSGDVKAATPSRAGVWIGTVACGAVALCAFVLGFHKIDNFDTWWHLAAGRWIATHRAIPATDTLSHTVRDHPWINLQWGFDLVLYLLHGWGGPALLCLGGAMIFLAAVVLLMRLVARGAGSSVAALVGLLVILTAQERVTLRPELLSFLLLACVLSVLDHGRRSEGRGLWLLVPLMIVWANVHALFVMGAFAIVCAIVGTATVPSRRLLIWGGAALASVVINPFGLTGVLFPLKLVSRINGSSQVFQLVGEFASPFAAAADSTVVGFTILLAIGGIAALAALILSRDRVRTANLKVGLYETTAHVRDARFDWGGAIFFVGLAVLAGSARRNVALFAIGSAPFIGQCLGITLSSRPWLREFMARRAPIAAVAVAIAAVSLAATVVTGAFYQFDNAPREFGAGVIEGTFPVRAAAFARAAALPSKLYNDMASGGYLAWDDPLGDGVFIDGRLEVYDTAFDTEYVTAVSDPIRWQADADRYGIQTAIIFHRFEPDRVLAGRLFQGKVWSLVYADEVAAVFVRTQGNQAALEKAASIRADWNSRTDAWLARPAPRFYSAGRVEGTRAYARFLATIGLNEPAVAAYLKLFELGIPASEEVDRRLLVARYFASHGRPADAQEQARRILALDPDNTQARALLK